jgi:hypothetical protein
MYTNQNNIIKKARASKDKSLINIAGDKFYYAA